MCACSNGGGGGGGFEPGDGEVRNVVESKFLWSGPRGGEIKLCETGPHFVSCVSVWAEVSRRGGGGTCQRK